MARSVDALVIAFAALYQPENVNDAAEAKQDLPSAPHRPVPALQCYLGYIAALLVGAAAWWVIQGRSVIEDPFWIGFAVTCVSTMVIWIFSVANDNSSIYDPYWVIAPPILALALKATGVADCWASGARGRSASSPVCGFGRSDITPCIREYRATGEYAKGGALRTGLWKYSRHPNYFGEVLFWLSMIPFAVPGGLLSQHPALVLIGPIMMAIFFRFSCRLMDVRSLERRPQYQQVVDEVSAMIPWWPK